MDDKQKYLGSYKDGSRPLLCAATHQPITGRHNSNHKLEPGVKGSDLFFSILTKAHHRLSREDMEKIRRRLQGLAKSKIRSRKAQTVPVVPQTEKDKE